MGLSKLEMVNNQLQDSINSCRTYLATLNAVTLERNEVLSWFFGLCEGLTKIINTIGNLNKQVKNKIDQRVRDTLILYFTQLLTSLSLLTNVFVKEEDVTLVLKEARNCVVKQILFCLDGIESSLEFGNVVIDPSGTFVKWMDDSLEKITEIDVKRDKLKAISICEEAKRLFEEVLCHAMSIAQVSWGQDCKIIRGSSQTVLNALASLTEEINKPEPNSALVNLFISTCSNKLCMLERKVNTAVLKLCLKTFSQFTVPLQRIHDFCFDSANKTRVEDLDNLVVDFDLHVDRIMQIGLFAVSCSSDVARGTKIRSCLASLEALEGELVPAFTSVLLDNSEHNVNCALVLRRHWLNQARALQEFIYLIIDPFAFCQIIYKEANQTVDDLSHLVKQNNILLKSTDVDYLIEITDVLRNFLDKAQKEFDEAEIGKVIPKLCDLHKVRDEVESASKLLLVKEKVNDYQTQRVLKRCKILVTVIKRVWYCFAEGAVENNDNGKNSTSGDLSSKIDNLNLQPTGNPFLDHIINRGKLLLEERSVLYRTPLKNNSFALMPSLLKAKKLNPKPKVADLRVLSFVNSRARNETSLDLQISKILSEITNLSTTFTRL